MMLSVKKTNAVLLIIQRASKSRASKLPILIYNLRKYSFYLLPRKILSIFLYTSFLIFGPFLILIDTKNIYLNPNLKFRFYQVIFKISKTPVPLHIKFRNLLTGYRSYRPIKDWPKDLKFI